MAISSNGGLGHMGVQYPKAMGLRVIGVDIANDKLEFARKLGADMVVNATAQDAVAEVRCM